VRTLIVLTLLVGLTASASAKTPPPPTQTAVVQTGREPCGIEARAGSVWVGIYRGGRLVKLHGATGRTEAVVPVGAWACHVAVGPAAVWVTRDRVGELVRISRGSGAIRRTRVGIGSFDVALAHGSAWTASFDTGVVTRVDAGTGRVERTYAVGPKPAGVAACGGSMWIGHGGTTTWLTAIDPATHAVRRVDVVLTGADWPRCLRGALWVTTDDSVIRVDPRIGALVAHYRLGGTPTEAALGPDGLIWVTEKERSLVFRIDAEGGHVVDSFPAGPGAFALARVGGAMWVTSFAGSDVRKFGP
jgi:streptogramin lyase